MPQFEDLDVFFDVDEFAVTAICADGETMPVIFDRAHIEAMGMGRGISDTKPIALARSADVAGNHLVRGSQLTVPTLSQAAWYGQNWWGAGPFTILELQPDGTGLTLLLLEAP